MSLTAQLDALRVSLECKIVRGVLLIPPHRQLICPLFSRLITSNGLDGLDQDFAGQDLVEKRARVILWASAAIAFVLGFALQNLKATFAIFTLGFVSCLTVTLPPLPAYNSHPVKWLDPLDEYGESLDGKVPSNSKDVTEGKKDR
ncbi:microsomal signal peptidase 12kDa subunit [Rhodotorula toruloides]|uniref:Signal peptidase complex subunit 1 n=1 Tax=Rhodotorula toruloides TaxID=5286 RepID=A0A511K8A9_RHOTO|nr:microsomal signal peptidase 12kDa subunit [Rhodotorula toruloides]